MLTLVKARPAYAYNILVTLYMLFGYLEMEVKVSYRPIVS